MALEVLVMDEEQLQSEYTAQLQQLDTKTKLLILAYLLYIRKHAIKSEFVTSQSHSIAIATKTLKDGITALISQGMDNSINVAERLAKMQFNTNLLSPTLTSIDKEKIIYSILLKSWSDGLVVADRIALLTNKMKRIAENIILQSQIAGLSASETASKLEEHFVSGGMEQRAMLRLTTHTINMVKELTMATIAKKSDDVIGIRIVRGMYGNMSEKCPICFEHGSLTYKEYFKSGYGGSDDDLMVMVSQPPFHSRCACGVEFIFNNNLLVSVSGATISIKEYNYQRKQEPILYEQIRNNHNDVVDISKAVNWKEEAIRKIKDHVFFNEHDLIGRIGRFDPDYEMAQAWLRLASGKYNDADFLLLKHEYLELTIMNKQGKSQPESHQLAEKLHNWRKAIE